MIPIPFCTGIQRDYWQQYGCNDQIPLNNLRCKHDHRNISVFGSYIGKIIDESATMIGRLIHRCACEQVILTFYVVSGGLALKLIKCGGRLGYSSTP